jgi:hypothetical protein
MLVGDIMGYFKVLSFIWLEQLRKIMNAVFRVASLKVSHKEGIYESTLDIARVLSSGI